YRFDGANFNHAAVVGVAGVLGNTFVETSGGMVGMLRMNDTTPLLLWVTQTKAGLSTTPAIVDGAVYIGAGDGGLYAFTPHGVNPVPAARKGPIVTITNAWTCTTTKQ
ncbi:MAG: PQQ-binding-like beta-propeller repeat protein, partial [Candidatus Baltobacteraceae bacterium]